MLHQQKDDRCSGVPEGRPSFETWRICSLILLAKLKDLSAEKDLKCRKANVMQIRSDSVENTKWPIKPDLKSMKAQLVSILKRLSDPSDEFSFKTSKTEVDSAVTDSSLSHALDVTECNTSNQVETENGIVNFSTSGEDTGEDTDEDTGEDTGENTGEDTGEEASFEKEDRVDEEDLIENEDNIEGQDGVQDNSNDEDSVENENEDSVEKEDSDGDCVPALANGEGGEGRVDVDGMKINGECEDDAINTDLALSQCVTTSQHMAKHDNDTGIGGDDSSVEDSNVGGRANAKVVDEIAAPEAPAAPVDTSTGDEETISNSPASLKTCPVADDCLEKYGKPRIFTPSPLPLSFFLRFQTEFDWVPGVAADERRLPFLPQDFMIPACRAISVNLVLYGVLIYTVIHIWSSLLPALTPRRKSHRNNSTSKISLQDKGEEGTADGVDNRNAIWMWNRENDQSVTPFTELYQKQDTDEWEIILKHLGANYTHLRPASTDILCYPIPRYPDNHNPLLPVALQTKLDEMTPREYLTYVLRELTLEERESLMVDERQRRKTFLVNWPRENNLCGVKMAQAGFYCVDDYDRVQCVFCRGSLHKWESGDNPMTEHSRSFNFCRFVRGLECGNREYRRDVLSSEEVRNISFFGNPDMERNRDGSISMCFPDCGIFTSKADQIEYTHEPVRAKTFDRWPLSSPIPAKPLYRAGFYYTGVDDLVRCFYCSGGLREWKPNVDPWEEHARWFPECSFLVQQKGVGFVNAVRARTPANKKCARMLTYPSGAGNEQKSLSDAMDDIYRRRAHYKWKRPHYWTPEGNVRQQRRRCQHSDEAEEDEDCNVTGPIEPRAVVERRRQAEEERREEALAQQWERDGAPQEQKDMALVCWRLGHSTDTILNAVRDCEEPFETIGDFIETIYKIEERQPPIREIGPGPVRTAATVGNVPNYLPAEDVPPENRGSVGRHPQGACVSCYIGTQQYINATRIGLPCGHMIFCEGCNREEQVRAADPEYKVRCPFHGCGSLLTGTLRTFLA